MNKRIRSQNPLPWWVELLFVQIGLPDSILRSFLKTRKRAIYYGNEYKNQLGILILLSLSIAYSYPIVRQAKNHNNCVISATDYIKNTLAEERIENKSRIKAFAINFCNGGSI